MEHTNNICTKANRTLGFLRPNLAACPLDVKESAYKGLVRPILEYGNSVWDPQSILLPDELGKVQKRAARFVTGNYVDYETGSMTGILKQLKWESLKKGSIELPKSTEIPKSNEIPKSIELPKSTNLQIHGSGVLTNKVNLF